MSYPAPHELWQGMRFHKEWNFIVEPWVWVGTPMVYLVSIFLLSQFMKFTSFNFDGFVLKQFMRLYNVVQIVGCSWMIYLFLPDFINFPDVLGLKAPFTKRAEFAMLMHYFSKGLDYLDTYFMILRRKQRQLSFLHVFHHATVLSIWGILLHASHGGSTAGFAAMLNSFVHVVMYSHYLVTSFGIRNPFKKYITMVQLSQFGLDFIHAIVVMCGFGTYPRELASLQFVYQIFMLVLFGNFYRQSYTKKPSKKSKPAAERPAAEKAGGNKKKN